MATPPPAGQSQTPYGSNPYAQPGQAPYAPGGQNPYGQQSQGAYAQPQAPYGQQATQYAQPGTPYAPPGQAPYGQQGAPHAQQGAPAGLPSYPGNIGCTVCGGYPAVPATVRGHQGFLVMMKFLKRSGVYCRTCGIATHREMTTKTLWQGWWGLLSMVITPVTLLMNLSPRRQFNRLPEPTGQVRQPRDPGKPVFARAGAFGALVPIVVIAVIAVAASMPNHSASTASVGDCVSVSGSDTDPNVKVVDCTASDAKYKVAERHSGNHHADACSQEYTEYDQSGTEGDFALCLTSLR